MRITKSELKERKAKLMEYIDNVQSMPMDTAIAEAKKVCPNFLAIQQANELKLKLTLVRWFIDDHTLRDGELW